MNFIEIPAVKKLLALNLPIESYTIAGTGIMFALGIRPPEDFTDIDICATGNAFEILRQNAELVERDDEWDCEHVVLYNKEIEAYSKFGPKEFDWKKAMRDSITIHGLPFWTLENVLAWKRMRNWTKDAGHIALIEQYLESKA